MTGGRPSELRPNAWTGEAAPAGRPAGAVKWGQSKRGIGTDPRRHAPAIIDERNWAHPEVGWGLVLPENEGLAPADRAGDEDAPPALRRLRAARPGSPVLRYRPDLNDAHLRRYYPNGRAQDLSIPASKPGIGVGRLPRYLLIAANPAVIPWSFQYALNMSRFTGRLALDDQALEAYVDALLSDWAGSAADPRAPLIWTVDHGPADITRLMATSIGARLADLFATDPDNDYPRTLRVDGGEATVARLVEGLRSRRPALVVTTSHGMTGPLADAALTRRQLGLLVDDARDLVDPASIIDAWSPSGAIWYAHACCSAGADRASRYDGLFAPGDPVGDLLIGIAGAAGAMVSPLPTALLGTSQPLRAFVGHVEPTFDWTLRDPANQQVVTHVLTSCLYYGLCDQRARTPLAFALAKLFHEAGYFFAEWTNAMGRVNNAVTGADNEALYSKLVAFDRQSLVILGDPTVALPLLT